MAKPILIIRMGGVVSQEAFQGTHEQLFNSNVPESVALRNDYHIFLLQDYLQGKQGFKFEVLNADKLEDNKILEVIEQLKAKVKLK